MYQLKQFIAVGVLASLVLCPGITFGQKEQVAKLIDAYIDLRFDAEADATDQLLKRLDALGVSKMADLETHLRGKRATYPDASDWVGKMTRHSVTCLHVDYESSFLMYLPPDFDPAKPAPLVVVGHGGNSSMSPQRAQSTADMYLKIYAAGMAKDMGAIMIAPASSRGWGHIGNSLIFSCVSKVQRMLPVDPDKIYITGQSMGGHLSFRAAISLPDRWGAVSPHSGGYDFVAKSTIGNLTAVPGYAIWGVREPYGINKDNRTNQKWAEARKLDWKFVEKNGGHTIYRDELPKVAKFFTDHPRNLFCDKVYFRSGGTMKFTKTWGVKGWPEHKVDHENKPLRWNLRHWIEVEPRPELKEPLELLAENKGNNQIEITSSNVRKLNVYLHPKLVDFEKPVSISVNGKDAFSAKVKPDPKIMFDLAREFDDRGRTYWAKIELDIESDSKVSLDAK